MKRLRNIMWIILWNFIGVFAGGSLYKYYDYKTHPDLYMMQSAPWYLSIQVNGVFTAGIVVICLIALWLIKRKMSSAEQ